MTDFASMDTLRSPANLDRIHEFQAFVRKRAKELGLPAESSGKLELVMEELAVNVMYHAYPDGQGDLEVHCLLENKGLQHFFCVRLRDWGEPFNPLTGEKPNTELDVEDRPVGGLGIFLAGEMADSIRYEREGDTNVSTFCFNLPES